MLNLNAALVPYALGVCAGFVLGGLVVGGVLAYAGARAIRRGCGW